MSVNDRLSALGLSLPSLPGSGAHYVPARQHGNLVFASGQTPTVADALTLAGKLGAEIRVEQGQEAARLCVLNCLAAVAGLVGDLDRIEGCPQADRVRRECPGLHRPAGGRQRGLDPPGAGPRRRGTTRPGCDRRDGAPRRRARGGRYRARRPLTGRRSGTQPRPGPPLTCGKLTGRSRSEPECPAVTHLCHTYRAAEAAGTQSLASCRRRRCGLGRRTGPRRRPTGAEGQ